ncbi:MAG: VWA domain-containing protein [Bacteroidetes Order II. Incertae sedis bacterium]|jgi:hypothetical protein|nr:VWA domain-containing protein [Bacteroidetes Order II. bacterium]MBT5250866.1 VWA domain-containing protein [Bacteroidetes Order II. bacterium]MBT6199623.1 VWA domain-containing protein [Bacteroidetes Order II. bacterium]
MTFLNPLLLIGLAAAAIPLIIHLFNFRRPQRVAFSSLAFLQELKKSTMQRVRIKQWLLLALRTLAIACFVLSFARPTLQGNLAGTFGARGKTVSALVFDNSTSMALRDGSGSYIDQAKALTKGLLSDFESGDEWILVPTPNVPPSPSSFLNAESVREAIDALEPQVGGSRLSEAISRAAAELDERSVLNKEIYVVSDLQGSTLSDSALVPVSAETRVVLLPVGTDGRGNVAVVDVQVISQIIAQNQPVQIEALFTNFGTDDVRGVVASVFIEDQRVGQATLDLGAGASSSARFSVLPNSRGWLAGRVTLDDNQYLYDNSRRFTLHVPEQRNILLVNGSGVDGAYLRLGLSTELSSSSARFNLEEVSETALSASVLGQFDAVVLNGVTTLSSGERAAVTAYVNGGGGLLIFPGDDMQLDDFNGLLSDLGAGRITGISAGSASGQSVGVFDRVDTDHTLFEGMFESDLSGRTPQLEQPVFFRMMNYVPAQGAEQTIISLTGDVPFLQEIRSGQGSVLMFGVEAGVRWSDLPVRGLFVPLLYRSLYYLSATASVSGESMLTGSGMQLRLAGVPGATRITIRDEAGQEFVPEQRTVLGAVVAELTGSFFIPGTYDVLVNNDVVRRIVVHPDPAESNLALSDPTDAESMLESQMDADITILDLSLTGASSLDDQLRMARSGIELWNVFLGLALIFLLLEMLVAKHWRPESAL